MKSNGQLSLNLGGEARKRISDIGPAPASELYFAILPDPPIATYTRELAGNFRRQYRFSTKPRRADLFHVTLYKIGSYHCLPEEAAFAAMHAASTVSKLCFQITFDRAVSFGNNDNRPLVLWNKDGNNELKALHRELDHAMRLTGIGGYSGKPIEPHMTLLYQGHLIPEIMLSEPVTWTVRDFVLINSLQGEATHEHLCYWPLYD